jgi:arylsulfatase A-like enzyme
MKFKQISMGWGVWLVWVWGCVITCGAVAAESPRRPNVLIAIADDWSYGHAGAYGCDWTKTPAFDRVAREGLLFTRAYTPNAKCAPSRACLLTGRNSWQLKAACNHVCYFPAEFPTFFEVLETQGYRVGCTGKGWGPGVAIDENNKPRRMTGTPLNRHKLKPPYSGIGNNDYAANFIEFLEQAPADQPWCFWYGAIEPHRGYEKNSGLRAGKRLEDVDHVPQCWPDNELVRGDMLDYAVEVEHFDAHLLRILETLEREGQLDDTIVVVTSDHGMPFPRGKGQAYDLSNHIPLAIRYPAAVSEPGRKVDEYVSLIDVAPTVLELCQVSWAESGMAPCTGQNLAPIFRATAGTTIPALRDHVLIGKERHDVGRPYDWGYPIRGIVRDGKLYLHNFEPDRWPAGNPETGYLNCDAGLTKSWLIQARRDPMLRGHWELSFGKRPAEELYDLENDPDCVHNLANLAEHQTLREQLRGMMEAELRAQQDPRMEGDGAAFEKYPYAGEQRDFYERWSRGEQIPTGWVDATDFDDYQERPSR